jgi:hypothetical protein
MHNAHAVGVSCVSDNMASHATRPRTLGADVWLRLWRMETSMSVRGILVAFNDAVSAAEVM